MDNREMRSQLQGMERAATEVLRRDVAFFEALQALKREIDRDPRVRSVLNQLRDSGHKVHSSFAPQVKVQIRTQEGIFSLHPHGELHAGPAVGTEAALTQQLRSAATAVIVNSRIPEELNSIVNEAISTSKAFEKIASEIEHRGYEVLICLDLSTYAQVRKSTNPVPHFERTNPPESVEPNGRVTLSNYDREFMRSLKIIAEF